MNHDNIDRTLWIFFVSLLILTLCCSTAAANQAGVAPLGTELQNGSYIGFAVTDKPVTLKDGKWLGEPYEKDWAVRPEITLLTGTCPFADFDQDGSEDTAVLLAGVTGFGFDSDRLVLSYTDGESGGALFFKRKQDEAVK